MNALLKKAIKKKKREAVRPMRRRHDEENGLPRLREPERRGGDVGEVGS